MVAYYLNEPGIGIYRYRHYLAANDAGYKRHLDDRSGCGTSHGGSCCGIASKVIQEISLMNFPNEPHQEYHTLRNHQE